MSFSKSSKSQRVCLQSSFQKRKMHQNSIVPVSNHIIPVSANGQVLAIQSTTNLAGPLLALQSNGVGGNYTTKPRILPPTTHVSPTGQTIHIGLPPPATAPPPPPPYPPVLMSVPPPPIRHIAVTGQQPTYSPSLMPPMTSSSNNTLTNGTGLAPHGSVHIHHGQLVKDPSIPISSNCVDRSTGYYSHSALAHHHHHHQPQQQQQLQQQHHHHVVVNGSQMPEVKCSPTISVASLSHDVSTASSLNGSKSSTSKSSNSSTSTVPMVSTASRDVVNGSNLGGVGETTEQRVIPPGAARVKGRGKTPMCLINELARHNKTTHQYRLTDESGPSHKKNFTVCLKLGDTEEYLATGPSIKKAQHAAAAIALEKTNLKHPVPKPKLSTNKVPLTPTVELNTLAMKRGETTVYTILDQNNRLAGNPPTSSVASSSAGQNFANKHLANKRFPITPSPLFRVSLKVGDAEYFGSGISAQAAKHDAATKALKVVKNLPPTSSVSSSQPQPPPGLNPKSSPFIPSSQKFLMEQNHSYQITNHTSSFETVSQKQQQQQHQLEEEDDLVKSPISLVHESALKRNLVAQFEVTKETGPPHMRKFITRCRCGEFVTDGEGNGKKASKKHAAELMLEKLRHLPPVISCQPPESVNGGRSGSKSSRSGSGSKKEEMKKRKAKNLIKLEQKASPDYDQSINPISRLIQIQQAKKEKEPEYRLIAEKGLPRRREFVMQATVGICSAKGSGPNKKLAKRAAAEALLQELGYSPKAQGSTSAQPAKPVLKSSGQGDKAQERRNSTEIVKKLTFSDESKTTSPSNEQQTIANSDKEVTSSVNQTNVSVNPSRSVVKSTVDKSSERQSTSAGATSGKTSTPVVPVAAVTPVTATSKPNLSPKAQLESLAEALSLSVSYRHINKKEKKDNFVSLLKLSTSPPKVFYGSGASLEESEMDAASKALLAIADSGIDDDDDEDDDEDVE